MRIRNKLLLVFLIMMLSIFSVSFASENISVIQNKEVKVTYNGNIQEFQNVNGEIVYPISYEGTTYLPIRSISTLFKSAIRWDEATNSVYLGEGELDTTSSKTVNNFVAGKNAEITAILNQDVKIYYNNEVQTFTDANGKIVYPISYNGTTYLPVRAVSNLFGLEIDWDGEKNTVAIKEKNTDNNKILIAVFSRSGENYAVGNVEVGNTEVMANYIKDYTRGDLFIIEPVTPYPNSYEETKEISTREKDNNERPEIKNTVQNFDEYDIIFLGYPIWYGSYPMIINTFLESYDFSGKTIIPFNTHEGSGNSGTYKEIERKMSDSTIKDGLAIKGSEIRDSKTQVEDWLKKLGF